jgi:hypothetical protein
MNESAQHQQYQAVVRKYGNPLRVLAESAILRYIGELTGDAELRYAEISRVTFPGADGIGEFEIRAGVTIAQMNSIQELWAKEKRQNSSLTAIEFARDNAQGVFLHSIEICDP